MIGGAGLSVGFLITTTIALAALGIGVFSWRRTVTGRRKLIWTVVSDIELLNPDVQELPVVEVRVRGHQIRNAALTTIRFWNGGTEPVLGSEARNPRIAVEDGNLAESWISSVTNSENSVRISDHNLTFDYLNRGDGAEITVVYSKGSGLPKLTGGFVGAELRRAFSIGEAKSPSLAGWFGTFALIFVGITFMSVFFQVLEVDRGTYPLLEQELLRAVSSPLSLFMVGAFLFMWVVGFAIAMVARLEREAEPTGERLQKVAAVEG